jgi:hypothetical protein
MGRRLAWDAIEQQIAAKAYVSASENNINGADQCVSTFADSIHRYVCEYQPLNADPKRFAGRDTKRILTFLKKDVLPDIQKFSAAIKKTKVALDTGNPSVDNILCMAIVYHVNKTYAGDMHFMTTGKNRFQPESLWDNYLA